MAVLHVYRDSLWVYGGRKIPNEGFLADEVAPHDGVSPADVAEEEDAEEEEEEEQQQHAERSSGNLMTPSAHQLEPR